MTTILCVDESRVHVNAAAILLLSIVRLRGSLAKIFVVSSERGSAHLASLIRDLPDSDALSFDLVKWPQDIYRAKLNICHIASRQPSGTFTQYVDSDHIIRNWPIISEMPAPYHLFVSSEVGPHFKVADRTVRRLNTSIIVGRAEDIAALREPWSDAYDDLLSRDVRHREEEAFSLAVARTEFRAVPLPKEVQGNFDVGPGPWSAFHYGGETPTSRALKEMLGELDLSGDRFEAMCRKAIGRIARSADEGINSSID